MRYQPSGVNVSAARARSSPPSGTGRGSHSSPTSSTPQARPVSGSTTRPRSPGAGRPNEPRRCSGWSASSSCTRHTLPGLGHAEHRVAQLGIGGPDVGGHDRPEVAAPDGGEVAAGEGRIVGQVGDRLREPVDHRRALALEHVEHARAGRLRSSRRGVAPATQRAEQRVGEAADPEERRVGEQHLVGSSYRRSWLRLSRWRISGAVRVDHALRRARWIPTCGR